MTFRQFLIAALLLALPLTARAEDTPTPAAAPEQATAAAVPAPTPSEPQPQATKPAATPAPVAPAPTTPAVAAKPAPSPEAARLALAQEIVKLFDLKNLLSSVLVVTSHTMAPVIAEANPGFDEKIETLINAAVQKAIMGHMAELEKNKATVYADVFSQEELEQLRDFYKSPAGQKMIKSTPEMMGRSAKLDRDLMLTTIQEANKEIVKQLKKNGMKVPKALGV